MPVGHLRVELAELNAWCRDHLGSAISEVLFEGGHLSSVLGVELMSARRVVVKVREFSPRLVGCAAVHRSAYEGGFPCPKPLVDLEPIGVLVGSAEEMVTGGASFPGSGRVPAPFAAALAWLVELTPKPTEIPSLDPRPPWTGPDYRSAELWPAADDRDVDLNRSGGPRWVDESGRIARERLAGCSSPAVVAHGDWYTGNLRWIGDALHVVWDWDSAITASESVIAGLAAAVYPATEGGAWATVAESEEFLDTYQQARRLWFNPDELQLAWAAGLWTRAFDAKKESATEGAPRSLTEAEALQRRQRATGSDA